ncbi:radical SAM protein [Candidatus Sumerlaeota bacterium]|nr:radical SAM protein [Candidatus Sumerlaeota bacterium]
MNSGYLKIMFAGPVKGVISRFHKFIHHGQYPTFLLLNITERCNCRCSMCQIWKKKDLKELSFEDFDRLFQDPLWKDLRILSLTGGEPFLRKDLKDILSSASRRLTNLRRISIPSNGILTSAIVETTKQILSVIPQTIDFKIGISIDGDEVVHDRMRGVPGAYQKAVETIRRLRSLSSPHFEVGVLSLITEQNVNRLTDIHHLLRALTPSMTWTLATESDFFDNQNKEMIPRSPQTTKKIIDFINRILIPCFPEKAYLYSKYKDHLIKKRRTYPCMAGYRSAYIDVEGNLLPCHYVEKQFCFGNFPESGESLEKIWFSKKANDIRKRLQNHNYCRNCSNNCDFRNMIQEDFWNFLFYILSHPMTILKALLRKKPR